MSPNALQLKRRGLKAAQDAVLDYSRDNLPEFFSNLMDELIDLTEQGAFVGSKHEYFYAGSKIKDSAGAITDSFVEHFKTTFKKFAARSLEDAEALLDKEQESSLALIEEEDLEERVTLTTIKQRAEGRFRDALWALNQRVSILNDGIPVDEKLNPLAPGRFCLAIRDSLRQIDISTDTRIEVYRVFDRLVMDRLGRIYQQANDELAQLHVLPNLRHSVVKAPERGFSPPSGGAMPGADGGELPDESAEGWLSGAVQHHMPPHPGVAPQPTYHGQLFANISALQDQVQWVVDPTGQVAADGQAHVVPQVTFGGGVGLDAGGVGGGTIGLSGLPVMNYSGTDFSQALHSLQQRDLQIAQQGFADASGVMMPRAVAPVGNNIVKQLRELLGHDKHEETDIKVADQKTIDLVGMVFRYMLNDDLVPHEIKTLLSYLHMPFLKVACADRELFAKSEHPARQLLNRLAEAGTRWTGEGKKDSHNVFGHIKEIVERLLEYTGEDVQPFENELIAFNQFLKRMEAKAELMEKRVAEQAQGEARLQKAKDKVRVKVKEMIDKRDLPSPLLVFLLQPWTDYLVFLLVRHGGDSQELKLGVKVIRDLFKGLETEGDERKIKRWKSGYSRLKERIEQGFEAIGYDEKSRKELIAEMEQVFDKSLQKKRVRPATKKEKKRLVEEYEEDMFNLFQQQNQLSDNEKQYLDQLQNVSIGTWFEGAEGKREKVSWFNLDTMQFLFVDHRGHRTGLRSGVELAQMLAAGELSVIEMDDRPLIDRSLEQIYADLCGAQDQLKGAEEEESELQELNSEGSDEDNSNSQEKAS
ncbi:DUF1631 family protein [Porticoccus sp. W117]|uniref:DUF1631 family protein n=1 Tax=Porticoccus sp. W117 TaxID=3054777 RepID=UPI0025935678|nr:DUF1631 family protein [Porticoccus sp. W117]MDM3870494.1 DUF1631 family protein [Porticoccus sp. W117]